MYERCLYKDKRMGYSIFITLLLVILELPLAPTCIKVCNREEFKLSKSGKKPAIPKVPYGHGKMMYAVKVSKINLVLIVMSGYIPNFRFFKRLLTRIRSNN